MVRDGCGTVGGQPPRKRAIILMARLGHDGKHHRPAPALVCIPKNRTTPGGYLRDPAPAES